VKRQKSIPGLSLSSSDAEAILCALPLITEIGAATPIQAALNAQSCTSAAKKLLSATPVFTSNELRVISASITASVLLLSGSVECGLDKVSSERKRELSKHFFTLNRLDPLFRNVIAEHHS